MTSRAPTTGAAFEPDPFGLERPRWSWGLLPAAGVALSALFLFGFRMPVPGYVLLVAGLAGAVLVDRLTGVTRITLCERSLAVDLGLIAVGIAIVSTTSVEADVTVGGFVRIGLVLGLAVGVPLLLDRVVLRRRAYTFPWRSHQKKTKLEIGYLVAVPALGWIILPFYFIRSGAYENWPPLADTAELLRFFVGVNAVGTWDELFFICTCFALLRRHFPTWQANILQATIFVSFLWELGYREWGPLLTAPFALLQGFLFSRTHSLGYVLAVHLLFDAIVFLAIVHAQHRDWLPIFVY